MARQTPLYSEHVEAGARFTEFAGWEMPLYFQGMLMERNSVRTCVGLFDLCHMGQIELKGGGAEAFLDYLLCSDVKSLVSGQAHYSLFCNEKGGIVDDLVVLREGEDLFRLVVNASRREADMAWIGKWLSPGSAVEVRDLTGAVGLVAVQGPIAEEVSSPMLGDLSSLPYFCFRKGRLGEHSCIISRTGYTGEDGFEIVLEREAIVEGWSLLRRGVVGAGGHMCGLGARDLLRLEAGYPLWGNEIDEETDPFTAGLGWVVDFGEGEFVGRDALAKMKEAVPERRLVAVVVEGPRVARRKTLIYGEGKQVGWITSGSFSSLTQSGVGLGYVERDWAAAGTAVEVDIGGRRHAAEIRRSPLYRGSVGRRRSRNGG